MLHAAHKVKTKLFCVIQQLVEPIVQAYHRSQREAVKKISRPVEMLVFCGPSSTRNKHGNRYICDALQCLIHGDKIVMH